MSLMKPRRRTPAKLAANRRNALKSTGPRTEAGKKWARLNGLRSGRRSKTYDKLCEVLLTAPVGEVGETAAIMLTPEERAHPVIATVLDLF